MRGYNTEISISQRARNDLSWWANNLDFWNGRRLREHNPSITIETDASRMGWGAFCQGETTGGCWDQQEQAFHINALEMLAVLYALKAFLKHHQNKTVLILSDNTSVVAHINKMGGTRSQDLIDLTKVIWSWCLTRDLKLSAQHIPGKVNITADFLSRFLRDRTDWTLNPKIFTALNQLWGPYQVDLFATRFSTQVPRFFSWRADPEAEATNAFTQSWSNLLCFAHPPWCLITRTLQKARREKVTITVITPLWKTQPWFPVIMDMVIDHPILLPESPDIVIPSPNCGCPVQDHIPQLVAWKVSGDTSETGQFLKVLESSSLPLGGQRQMLTTTRPGGTWRKWEEWCTSHCVPTFSAFSDILGFLAHHFEQGKQYRSLNCYRSALSSCHLPIKGFSVGQHPLVSRLLKGAFNLRPPQPKYSSTWDVSTMLRYLLSLGPNDNLCLEKLTRKLAVLLALVLAHGASDLVRLSLVGSTYTTEGVVLTI